MFGLVENSCYAGIGGCYYVQTPVISGLENIIVIITGLGNVDVIMLSLMRTLVISGPGIVILGW